MNKFFSIENSLEAIAALIAIVTVPNALYQFYPEAHFVIPTMMLLPAIYFGNLARFGVKGQRWAKHMLFWTFSLMAIHAFFALFWAAEARPGALFGSAFYPVYGGFLVIVGGLCIAYAKRNKLFGQE